MRRLAAAALGWFGIPLVSLVVLTSALLPFRSQVGLFNIGLLYLLFVVLVAARWGWAAGIIASFGAYLALDFFFVPPLHGVLFGKAGAVLELLVFLSVALIANAFLAHARASATAARRQRQEMETLYDLSQLISAEGDAPSILSAVCTRVCDTFGAEAALVLVPGADGLVAVASAGRPPSVIVSAAEQHAAQGAFSSGAPAYLSISDRRVPPRLVRISGDPVPTIFAPLRVRFEVAGLLQVVGWPEADAVSEERLRLLEAFAGEAARAVDRDRVMRQAAHAEALQETARLQSALLGAVSHDLRTPLASIKWSVTSLLEPGVPWDDAARRDFLTAIDEETDRLTAIISNVLDISRIEAGAMLPRMAWHNVRELLETTVGRLSRLLSSHHITLEAVDDLGEARFDYVQIGQALTNLIENAAKFAPRGTEIRVCARRLVDAVEITVEDEGPGIPPEERERVFEKFYRGERSTEYPTGIGLGLAICKGLVEAHGGRVAAEEAPGGGARVIVRLPAEQRPPPAYIPTAAVAR